MTAVNILLTWHNVHVTMGIVSSDILFEVQDYAGIPVRTTYSYWQKYEQKSTKS